jgi:hypothetical protein
MPKFIDPDACDATRRALHEADENVRRRLVSPQR